MENGPFVAAVCVVGDRLSDSTFTGFDSVARRKGKVVRKSLLRATKMPDLGTTSFQNGRRRLEAISRQTRSFLVSLLHYAHVMVSTKRARTGASYKVCHLLHIFSTQKKICSAQSKMQRQIMVL